LLKNPPFENRDHIDFKNTKRLYCKQLRKLPSNIFERRLLNGECKNRSWLLYSKSKNALFCFQCLIFATKKQVFSDPSVGFTNWQKCHHLVAEHEKSLSHSTCVRKWFLRTTKNTEVIDNALHEQVNNEINYWKNVLHRVVSTIQFLSERGLAFRGENENFNSKHNGNYLGCLELISKFDAFLGNHISNHGNKGRGNVSYLSSTICDEFISLMSKTVIDNIVIQIKKSKYFSIIVDSTPDNTKVDQLTIIIRYITDNSSIIERFVGFLKSVGHKGEDMETALIQRFTDLDINFKNCRGQSYDNASNMSGIYNGLQARIKRISKQALFVPCAAHSLNLVGSNAAEATSEGTRFFFNTQMVFNFFSSSTSRWELLEKYLNKIEGSLSIKNLCKTRWSSRYDVCKSLNIGYKEILNVLEVIYSDKNQRPAVCHEAKSIYKKMSTLEFSFMLCMWYPILKRFEATSKALQLENIDLSNVISLYISLRDYIEEIRNSFYTFLEEAKTLSGCETFVWESSRKKIRPVLSDDDTNTLDVIFMGSEKMKNETFLIIIDKLIFELNRRMESYNELNNKFGFILNIENESLDNIRKKSSNLVEFYNIDLESDLGEKLIQFKSIMTNISVENKKSFIALHKTLITSSLEASFPNIEIILRIICILPSSNASGERSFSVLKRIKNFLRSSLDQEKMSDLSILCIESEIVREIKWEELVNKFDTVKLRKKHIC